MAWVPLESNPEVMTALLRKWGVPNEINVVDVFSLEPEMLLYVPQPVEAILLLFPCDDEYEQHRKAQEEEVKAKGQNVSESVFFMKQVVSNACGTIALIHSIANMQGLTLTDGFLKKFIDEAKPLDPDARGDLLHNADGIVSAHKEVAEKGQTAPPDENEPVPYHFVAFVVKDGSLYELDGRKSFPINHGESNRSSLIQDAVTVCKKYMDRNPNSDKFSICAVSSGNDQ